MVWDCTSFWAALASGAIFWLVVVRMRWPSAENCTLFTLALCPCSDVSYCWRSV
jgi:hypothetical protein